MPIPEEGDKAVSDEAQRPESDGAGGPEARLNAMEDRLARLEGESRALREAVQGLTEVLRVQAAPPPPARPVAVPPRPLPSMEEVMAASEKAPAPSPPPPPPAAPPPAAPPTPVPPIPGPLPPARPPVPPGPPPPSTTARPAMPAKPGVPMRPAPAPVAARRPMPPVPPRPPIALEDLLAKGLLGIGGILLLVGAAVGAVLLLPIMSPLARVAVGFMIAAALAATGFGLSFKALWPGRVVFVIGASLAFFTSFSAGFIPMMAVFPVPVSVALMFLLVGVLAVCSESWKSEIVAGFGFLLGLIAALASAPTSQAAALVALVILAVAAGALLVRHEWKFLNAAGLVMIALGTLVMWALAPVPPSEGVVIAHLGALACYYVVFSLAFARWGRVALARERLAIEAPEQHATPRINLDPATMAYSSVFAQVNSVVFGSLALLLLSFTEIFWPVVYVPLLVMAALEAGRLMVPVLRRGGLLGFHTVTSLGLVASAIVAYYSGLAESAVLGLMTMVVAMVASRSRLLGWLRPLTLVTACLTLKEVGSLFGAVTPADLLARLLPPLFLLASVLPWESIAVLRPRRLSAGIVELLEAGSGSLRAALASVLMTFVLLDYFPPDGPSLAGMVIVAKGIVLIGGILLLGAWNWFAAATLAVVLGTLLMGVEVDGTSHAFIAAVGAWALLAALLWHELARRSTSTMGRVFMGMGILAMTGSMVCLVAMMTPRIDEWNGLYLSLLAVAILGMGLLAERLGAWPELLPLAPLEEGQWSYTAHEKIPDDQWRFIRVAWGVGIALALAGWAQVITLDSQDQLISALLIAAVWYAAWHISTRTKSWHEHFRWPLAFAVLFTLCPAMLVADEVRGASVATIFLFATGMVVLGASRRELSMLTAAGVWLVGLGLLALVALAPERAPSPTEGWLVLAVGVGLVIVATAARRFLRSMAFGSETLMGCRVAVLVSGVLCLLTALACGATVSGTLMTASWGLAAALLLVSGFMVRDALLRYAAFAVFVLAIGRIVFSDMARMDTFTRFVAFFGVGLLMIIGGVVYWLLRPKSPSVPKVETTEGGM